MTRRRHQVRKSVVHLVLAGALAASAVPARAQDTVTPIGQAALPPQTPAGPAAVLTRAQIEAMLAPIALYPDQLLTQILMAAAYPQEVVEADRWVGDPANANLTGEQLEAALAPIDWDPSVKSLVPFPQVLATMAEHLDWTQALGAAFVAQQADVLDAVQGLRRQAQAAGTLRSTPQITVAPGDDGIVIEPADPGLLYVPLYDPDVVYGGWSYPAYPPVAIYQPPYYYGYYGAPIIFSVGFVIVHKFWNWHHCDWRQHRVWVDPPRVNAINADLIARHDRSPIEQSTWHADPHHGRGVSAPTASGTAAAAPHSSSSGRQRPADPAATPSGPARPGSVTSTAPATQTPHHPQTQPFASRPTLVQPRPAVQAPQPSLRQPATPQSATAQQPAMPQAPVGQPAMPQPAVQSATPHPTAASPPPARSDPRPAQPPAVTHQAPPPHFTARPVHAAPQIVHAPPSAPVHMAPQIAHTAPAPVHAAPAAPPHAAPPVRAAPAAPPHAPAPQNHQH